MKKFILTLTIASLLFACSENKTEQKQETKVAADSTLQKNTLTIDGLDASGDLGQVTFSQGEKTLFYYNHKSKSGKVSLNGKEYVLDKFSFDTDSYSLSGEGVTISAPGTKYKENAGEDCGYGTVPAITIKLGVDELKIDQVDVQDCPDYD